MILTVTNNRIFNEMKELYNQGYNVSIKKNANCLSQVNYYNTHHILIITDDYNNKYKFDLPCCYPFEPPLNIVWNEKQYYTIVSFPSSKFSNILKKEYGIKCLCCYSLLCKNIWRFDKKISDIINQLKNIKKIKINICKLILFEKIQEKYNCYFFNIKEYIDFSVTTLE